LQLRLSWPAGALVPLAVVELSRALDDRVDKVALVGAQTASQSAVLPPGAASCACRRTWPRHPPVRGLSLRGGVEFV